MGQWSTKGGESLWPDAVAGGERGRSRSFPLWSSRGRREFDRNGRVDQCGCAGNPRREAAARDGALVPCSRVLRFHARRNECLR